MSIIYSVGWIIIVIVGYIILWKLEKNNPKVDYSLAGFFIVSIALTWPITVPILLIRYLTKQFRK